MIEGKVVMPPPLIGITGTKGSGKSSIARRLEVKWGFTILSLAAPIKAMCLAAGMSESDLQHPGKEKPLPMICGRTPRYFMQRLGTEFGRDLIGYDLWIRLWRAQYNSIQSITFSDLSFTNKPPLVVVDDVRFENEAAMIGELDGSIWKVERAQVSSEIWEGEHEHLSESSIKRITEHLLVQNQSTNLTDLYKTVDNIMYALDGEPII